MPYEYTPHEYLEERDLAKCDVWFLDAVHSIPPWTPSYAWAWVHHLDPGWKYGVETLSIPTTKGVDSVILDSCCYVTPLVVASEEERKQREVVFRQKLTPWIENFDKERGAIISEMLGHYARLDVFDLEKASNFELLKHFKDCLTVNKRMWEVHFVWQYAAFSLFFFFENMCRELLGIDDTSPLFLKSVRGFDNELTKTDRMLWVLTGRVAELGLDSLFRTTPDQEVIPALEGSESGRSWLKEFRDFLKARGWRIPRFTEFAGRDSAPWIEDPTPAITNIKQFLAKGGEFSPDIEIKAIVEERKAAAEEIMAQVPLEQKAWFETLLNLAPGAGAFSEDHNFYLDHHMTGLMRGAYLEWGKRYAAAGAIDERDDIFFLVPDEIIRTALTPERYNFRSITDRRKGEWEANCKKEHPPIIGRLGMEEGIRLLAADPVVLKVMIGSLPVPKPELKADLYGICGAPGAAEGTARVIFSPDQFSEVQPGDILVAPTTYSSWTPLFAIIKGAIVDRGGTLVHAAIVGREYGIPVVINCFEGTAKIKSGQRVKVDGDLGVVYILGE